MLGCHPASTHLANSQLSACTTHVFSEAQAYVPACSQDGCLHPDIHLGPCFSSHCPWEPGPPCSSWFRWKVLIITDTFPVSPPNYQNLSIHSLQPKQISKQAKLYVLSFLSITQSGCDGSFSVSIWLIHSTQTFGQTGI